MYAGVPGYTPLAAPTQDNVDQWLDLLDGCLSPENLTCDGELRGKALAQKSRELNQALRYCQGIKDPGMADQTYGSGYAPRSFTLPKPVATKKPGDQITFRGNQYTIVKIKRTNYEVTDAAGKRYNLKIAAVI